MKKIYLLLGIAFLLQSCYSYKSVEINPKTMALGQTYKLERNHKTIKAVYTQNADSVIYVLKNGKEEKIAVKDITYAKERKFSWVKTASLYPITVIGFFGLLLLTWN